MKTTLSKIAIVAVAGLVVAAFGAPANAGCPGSQILDATFTYLISNPNWNGIGGTGTCEYYGCFASEGGPPVSPAMKGVFWSVGSGNPAIGLGNDSGIFSGGFSATDFWLKAYQIPGTDPYYYSAFLSLKLGSGPYPGATVGPPVSWSFPDVDGCGPANPPAPACTCFLLTDQWNGAGYFATLCAQSDQLGNTRYPVSYLADGSVIRLAPIPGPSIVNSARDVATGDVTLTVGAGSAPNTPNQGVYSFDGCGTGLQGYRVYGAVVPRGGTPTPGQFAELPRADGTSQGNNAFGAQVSVRADCNPGAEQDLYLQTRLVGEGATPFMSNGSAASTRVPCGANLATPGRGKGEDPRPDRGRDHR